MTHPLFGLKCVAFSCRIRSRLEKSSKWFMLYKSLLDLLSFWLPSFGSECSWCHGRSWTCSSACASFSALRVSSLFWSISVKSSGLKRSRKDTLVSCKVSRTWSTGPWAIRMMSFPQLLSRNSFSTRQLMLMKSERSPESSWIISVKSSSCAKNSNSTDSNSLVSSSLQTSLLSSRRMLLVWLLQFLLNWARQSWHI